MDEPPLNAAGGKPSGKPEATLEVTPEQWLDAGVTRGWIGRLLAEIMPEHGLDASALPAPPEESVGGRIGPYKLLQQIGEGGMGVVFRAEQQEPVRRMVALKVIKAGMDTVRVVARFAAERQALALMDHPNIAKVLDAGATQSGRPFFVMELVQGIPITKYCTEQRLTLRQRLELFVSVCQGIQHAHQKGIIHRDIKSSNVLVATYDGTPVPKVIDFGLAKAIGGTLSGQTLFTGFGALVGTLEYMSPEQAQFNALDIDTRSDIYSLGVLLYELLTGTTPLTRQRIRDASLQEVLRWIREEEPPSPSTRLSDIKESSTSVSEQRHIEPGALVKSLRGEVDWIVMKCLEKDRTRRYETANGLARDIQRYLADEPVEAGPPSKAYRLRKLAWKHRRGLATAAALLLLLVAGSVVSIWQAVRTMKAAEAERQANILAQTRLDQIEKANAVLTSIFHDLDPRAEEKGGPSLRQQLSQHLQQAATQLDEAAIGHPVTVARLQTTLGDSLLNLGQIKLAIEVLEKAEKTLVSNLGPEHPDTLESRNSLASAYEAAGRTTEAISLFEQNLKQSEAKLGPDHPNTLTSRNNLAEVYGFAGRTDEAIRLLELTLKQSEAKLGPDHPSTLTSRNNLALAYGFAGRIAEAISLFEQNLQQREAKLGLDHPDTLVSRNNLASAYFSDSRTAEAIRLFEQTLKQQEAKLGLDHPDTLASRNNLALANLSAGRIAEAIRLHEQNLKQLEAKLGPDHLHTLQSRSNLAEAYDRAGQFVKSESLYRAALDQAHKRFGTEDPRTAGQMAMLGANLLYQHKYADAEPLLHDCLKIREAKEPDAWTTFNTQSLLGGALLGQKKYAEAEPQLLQGYEGMKRREAKIPSYSKNRLTNAVERLVKLYEATGKKDEADKWRKELEQSRKANADATKK